MAKGPKQRFNGNAGYLLVGRLPETACAAHRIFSLTPNRARHPLGVLLRTFDQRRSPTPGDSDCYRRLGEIPQQVVRRQTIPKTPGGTMEIRSLLALVGLAISFALPTFAQQT